MKHRWIELPLRVSSEANNIRVSSVSIRGKKREFGLVPRNPTSSSKFVVFLRFKELLDRVTAVSRRPISFYLAKS